MWPPGRSYMLWTICTALVSVFCVLLQSTAGNAVGKIVILVLAPPTAALNLFGILSFAYREWVNPRWQLFPHHLFPHIHLSGKDIPWRLARVVDHYFALMLSWALVFLLLWMWDPTPERNRYIELENPISVHNVWSAWLSFIALSVQILNEISHTPHARHPVSEAIVTAFAIIAWFCTIGLFGLVLTIAGEAQLQLTSEQPVVNSPIVSIADDLHTL